MIFCFVTCLIERKPLNKEFRLFIIVARGPRISSTPFHNHNSASSFAPVTTQYRRQQPCSREKLYQCYPSLISAYGQAILGVAGGFIVGVDHCLP
jgi:hypothetical protein